MALKQHKDPSVDWVTKLCYNTHMNTKQVTPKKHREHYVLFCAGTPFKQKRVELKTRYNRQPKHKGQHND